MTLNCFGINMHMRKTAAKSKIESRGHSDKSWKTFKRHTYMHCMQHIQLEVVQTYYSNSNKMLALCSTCDSLFLHVFQHFTNVMMLTKDDIFICEKMTLHCTWHHPLLWGRGVSLPALKSPGDGLLLS